MNIFTESLWGDEAFLAILVHRPLGEMLAVIAKDTSPPLIYLLHFVWVRIFGDSEIALRSLSVLLAVGGSFFAYKLSQLFTKNKLYSLILSVLVFVTPFTFVYAFEARMYTLLILTVFASTYFLIKKSWVPYCLFALGALYTHNIAIFVLMAQGLVFFLTQFAWKKPKLWLKQLLPFIAIGLLYLPWLIPLLIQLSRINTGGGFWLGKPTVQDLWELTKKIYTGGIDTAQRPVAALLTTALLVFKDWKKVWKPWTIMTTCFLLPVLLAFIFSQFATPIFYDRYLMFAVAGGTLIFGVGLKQKAYPLLVALLILYTLSSFTLFNQPHKKPFRELADYVKSHQTEKDYLLNISGQAHHIWESKYYGIPAPIYTPQGPLPLFVGTAQMTAGDMVSSLPKASGRIGTISSEPPERIMLPGYKQQEVHQFDGLNFIWWKKI